VPASKGDVQRLDRERPSGGCCPAAAGGTLTARGDGKYRHARRCQAAGVIAEGGGGNDTLGHAVTIQQRPDLGPETAGEQLGAQEQRDHLRLAARP